jgi:transposase
VYEKKEHLTKEIFYAGKPFEKEVKLLISIKGITPLSALAFLSDVGDVCRFQDNEKNERLSWPCSKAEGKR